MSSTRKTTVLITGCTPGGIGHSLATEFHRRGCHVIATARNPEILKGLEAQGFSIAQLDVTDQASVDACKIETERLTGGKLDILVNNAGRPHVIPILDGDMDDIQKTYDVNVFGPMRTVKAFIPLLIKARGLIVNISSTSSQVPYLFGGIYSSTKGAIDVWSRALRLELEPFNVRVMVAMTGTVKSNFAGGPHRSLPEDSLYMPVKDKFEWRLTFSQKHGTFATDQYAKAFVDNALKGEGWVGGLVGGSPSWFWCGGLTTKVWLLTLLPRVVMERILSVYWGMGKMKRKIEEAARKRVD